MSPTLRDVAAQAGVSVATASRAFRRPEKVDPGTRERVLGVAETLNYTPNRTAQALSTGRSGTIGVIVPDLVNPFFPAVVKGAQARAHEFGLQVLLGDTDEVPEAELPLVRTLAPQVDGIVLCSARMTDAELAQAAELVPIVLINRELDPLPGVALDPEPGMRSIALHLKSLGHRRVAYVGGPERSFSNRLRRATLDRVFGEVGLTWTDTGVHPPTGAGGRAATEAVLTSGATAVVAYNDIVALGLIGRLAEYGVAVPDQISVVGWDDIDFAGMYSPGLTTVRMPRAEAGRRAVDLLMATVNGLEPGTARSPGEPTLPESAPPSAELTTEIIFRRTTGPAPAPVPTTVPTTATDTHLPEEES